MLQKQFYRAIVGLEDRNIKGKESKSFQKHGEG